MTEKRFVIPNQMRVIRDTVTGEEAIFYDTEDGLIFKEWLNTLHDENEQLKSEIEKLSYANEDLLSEKRNWQRMSDEYCKLSEENEQLKQQLGILKGKYKGNEHLQ